MSKARRPRVLDSRNRPVKNLYIQHNTDGTQTYYVGHNVNGKWKMAALDGAYDLTSAKIARDKVIASHRDGTAVEKVRGTMDELFSFWLGTKTCSARTISNYRHLWSRHADFLADMQVQAVGPDAIARRFREMAEGGYSEWTRSHVRQILSGMFKLAVNGRGPVPVAANPLDVLERGEKPKQVNKKDIVRLDLQTVTKLVGAGSNERWQAALALAGFAGLRLGEIRGLRWEDLLDEEDRIANSIHVSRSALPDGTLKTTKTEAGVRVVPLVSEARRLLTLWKLKSAHSSPDSFVISTRDGNITEERNMRRALESAIDASGIAVPSDERLSWHSLRHSAASIWLTEYRWAPTAAATYFGNRDATTMLGIYARDPRSRLEAIERDLKAVGE